MENYMFVWKIFCYLINMQYLLAKFKWIFYGNLENSLFFKKGYSLWRFFFPELYYANLYAYNFIKKKKIILKIKKQQPWKP